MNGSDGSKSWSVSISADDMLNFIIYIGCIYGLIDKNKYSGREILWPTKSLRTVAVCEQWEEWFQNVIRLKAERIKDGKYPHSIIEDYMPQEFLKVEDTVLKECCITAWPFFQEWWYMLAGGKNALAFIETINDFKILDNVNEVEKRLGRKLKPFRLNIELLYTGINGILEVNEQLVIVQSNPIISLDKEWWIKKLTEIG